MCVYMNVCVRVCLCLPVLLLCVCVFVHLCNCAGGHEGMQAGLGPSQVLEPTTNCTILYSVPCNLTESFSQQVKWTRLVLLRIYLVQVGLRFQLGLTSVC